MKKISQTTFEEKIASALDNNSTIFHDAIDWFANDSYTIFGTIIRDKIDSDYSAVVLEKNETNKYAATTLQINFSSKEDAKKWLETKLN